MFIRTLRNWVWVVALLPVLNCSASDEPRRGQLMVALQGDMSVPQGFDTILMLVYRDLDAESSRLEYYGTFEFPPRSEVYRLPGTVAIVEGSVPNELVKIEVVGLRNGGGSGRETRTLARAVTRIPKSEIRTLHMPVQWLCTGSVEEDPPDVFLDDCELDESCIAGSCEPADVDQTELPLYSALDIFGGAPLGSEDGICFDTWQCFNAGFDIAPIDPEACQLELAVPDGHDLNIGLKFLPADEDGEPSPGICNDSRQGFCYIPLEKDDKFGWRVVGSESTGAAGAAGASNGSEGDDMTGGGGAPPALDGSRLRVQLPRAACRRWRANDFLGFRASYACPSKELKYPVCGPWSNVAKPAALDLPMQPATTTGGMGIGTPMTCPQLVPGVDVAELTNNPAVATFIDQVLELTEFVDAARSRTADACELLAQQPPADFSDAALVNLCRAGMDEVNRVTSAGNLLLMPSDGYCSADTELQLDCEQACGGAELCAGDDPGARCEVSARTAACDGPGCVGMCYGNPSQPTSCAGACFGECNGSCLGVCTGRDGQVSVWTTPGTCTGMCEGECTGQCAGSCTTDGDECDAACLADVLRDPSFDGGTLCPNQGSQCSVPLAVDAACSVELDPQSSDFTERKNAGLCASSCALAASLAQSCQPTRVTAFADGSGVMDFASDVARIEQGLAELVAVGLEGQPLEVLVTQLNASAMLIDNDDLENDPVAIGCFNAAQVMYAAAIRTLQTGVTAALDPVFRFSFASPMNTSVSTGTDDGGSFGTGGGGGTATGASTTTSGGMAGFGGASGGQSGTNTNGTGGGDG